MSSSSGLQVKELNPSSSPKCRIEENVADVPEQVELALHAKPGVSTANELPLTCSQEPIAPAGIDEQPNEEQPNSRWDRVLRTMVRCLVYCIERIAAGFGLSRQQTGWYKHCWDSPAPRPRGISYLGANDMFIAPLSLMDELAEENDI